MDYQVQENCLTIFLPKEVDHHNAEEIRKSADSVIEKNHIKYVIFDFKDTEFMDSSGIAVALRGWQRMQELGGTVTLRHVAQQPRKVLEAAGIGRMMTIE